MCVCVCVCLHKYASVSMSLIHVGGMEWGVSAYVSLMKLKAPFVQTYIALAMNVINIYVNITHS